MCIGNNTPTINLFVPLAGEDPGQYFTGKLSSTLACWADLLTLTRKWLNASVEGGREYITITTGNDKPGAIVHICTARETKNMCQNYESVIDK
jgi:hypothetical protein